MHIVELPNRRATIRLARALATHLRAGDLVVLDGGLGAGKTFLVRAMLRALGVGEAVPVPSPTFTLMNEYGRDVGARVPVVHADLYRLLGPMAEDSIADLGLRERRGDGWAVVVEWGGEHLGALGADAAHVELRVRGPMTVTPRSATLEGMGPRGEALARAVIDALGNAPAPRGLP
jgi:tRNA threonylcarbamoyl adenosine modification protein YjeE